MPKGNKQLSKVIRCEPGTDMERTHLDGRAGVGGCPNVLDAAAVVECRAARLRTAEHEYIMLHGRIPRRRAGAFSDEFVVAAAVEGAGRVWSRGLVCAWFRLALVKRQQEIPADQSRVQPRGFQCKMPLTAVLICWEGWVVPPEQRLTERGARSWSPCDRRARPQGSGWE
ncbi:hypothetical protein LZ31DRAFT_553082 [Colletotrichum somersetense]|nr:hypothetical protein LZ31DRAFT_553082 [Colletotrichum somersetense]